MQDAGRGAGARTYGERIFFLRYRGDRAMPHAPAVQTRLDLPLFPDLAGATRTEPVEAYQVHGPYPSATKASSELELGSMRASLVELRSQARGVAADNE